MVDLEEHHYGVAIQDYDGFTMSGSTRYVAYDGTTRGRKILLGKATMVWPLLTDIGQKTNLQLNSANTYSKHMPVQKHVGIKPRTFNVECAIVQGSGLDKISQYGTPSNYTRLTIPLLLDLLYFNHRYYITDYFGTTTTTETPIYQLVNETTSLYYSMYTSQSIGFRGLPVIITGVSNFRVDPDDPGVMTCQMTFVEDTAES